MSAPAFFGIEIALVVTTSFIVIIHIGKTLRNILIEICGTAERADFWIGFIRLTFIFLPLLIVLFFGDTVSPQATSSVETVRKFLIRLMFGELITLSVIGLILWRTIAGISNTKKEG